MGNFIDNQIDLIHPNSRVLTIFIWQKIYDSEGKLVQILFGKSFINLDYINEIPYISEIYVDEKDVEDDKEMKKKMLKCLSKELKIEFNEII